MSPSKIIETAIRYLRFAASTLAGTAVDMLVLWLCSRYLFKGHYWGEYLLSPFISFECAVLTNFVLAYYSVWKDRVSVYDVRSFFRHYAGYNLFSSSTFLVKMGVLLLIERFSGGWDVLVCNLLALCVSGFVNFVLNEHVVFRKKGG
ncbi:MAG: GtrA family protein [Paludibacteraceae bacterium]|nr:GtrA family protein [Paludibacteraceae bacterium]MBQ7997606.1 GtrA family protein [Paludibacteraceae bacterium]